MAYRSNLGGDRVLYIENSAEQTRITLTTSSPTQQQSQSHSITTGRWQTPPTLYQSAKGLILRLEGTMGQTFVQIQAQQMSSASTPPDLSQASVLGMDKVEDTPSTAMPAMSPMQPLKMGDMSMSMQPMEMKMGNMSLSMNETPKARFCTQCGNAIREGDRFCGACGTALSNSK
ncbi:MAG: zinc ribbon domain-containing protein [Jaaginema sp. PMC 1079.18]|nr:zinc ribbon domain-containing protein [Jaaginema sp. PMC 1080.18]MEC4853320.1 zinc ribbon domain-containing protein [Jaaginema sp. PMC 1079.18]MEC4866736.1 zinc ribbon domain-containing protein [Jaaginema sp. PMC 1078.18]